jgi:hypothetical protein
MSDVNGRNGNGAPAEKLPRSRTRDEGYATANREVRERYAGLVIAVYDCEVWGTGQTADEALAVALARPGAPKAAEFVVGSVPPPPDPEAYWPLLPRFVRKPKR